MSLEERKVGLSINVDPTQANQGLDQVAQKAQSTAATVEQAGRKGAQGVKAIGDGAHQAAEGMSRSEASIIASIKRASAAAEAGGRGTAAYFEKIGQIGGYTSDAFKRAIDGLQAIEASQKKANSASAAAESAQQSFIAGLREQIALQGKSAEEALRYRAAQLGVGDAAGPLILQLQSQKAAQAAAAQAAREEAESQKQASASKQRAADQQASFIASLRDQVAVQGKSQAEVLRYRAAQLGVSRDAEQYIAQLERVNSSTGKVGVSAAQTAAALRGVPAQFTDIVTALQGGQQPLTVFLQQGGQLKDMFGGAGAAAKALGGYVLGLVNPFTVSAAAVGALSYAFYKGAQEQQDFQRTLILTGNAAGVTATQLGAIAAQVGAMGGGTTGRAAEVLNQIAASGKVAAGSLASFTDAALKMERAGGPAAEETAKAFADLAKSPLDASLKLNEATNYLTRSVYEQIKALEEQGKTSEAAAVAQKAYADALNDRAPAMLQNLGLIERAWLGIKDAAKGAADDLLSIGRADGIAELQRKLNNAQVRADNAGPAGLLAVMAQRDVEALKEQLDLASRRALKESESAAAAKQRADSVKAGVEFDKESDKYLSKREQMEREIAKARQIGLAAGREEADIARLVGEIRSKYDNGLGLQGIKNAEALKLEALKTSQLELDRLRASTALNEREYIAESSRLTLQSFDIRIDAAKKELAIAASKKDSDKDVAQIQGQIALLTKQRSNAEKEGRDKVSASIQAQRRETEKLNEAEREQARIDMAAMLREQEAARNQIAISLQQYNRSLDDEAERMRLEVSLMGASSLERQTRLKQFEIELDLRRKLQEIDRTVYEGGEDEREQARQKAREAAARASAQAQTRAYLDEWQKANDQLTQSLTDAITQGIMGGQGAAETLRKAIVAALVTRPIQIAVQALVQPVMGQVGQFLMGSQGGSFGANPWFSNFGGAVSGAADTLGLNLFNAGFKDSGAWLMMNQGTIGKFAGYLGNGLGYLGALSALSNGKVGSGIGAGLGTYLGGPIGGAIGGSIGSLIDGAFSGNGKDFYGADYMASSKTGGYRPGEREVGDRQWGWSITGARSSQVEQTLKALTDSSLASLNQLQSMFGGSSEFKLGTYFSSNGENGSQGNIKFIKDGQTLAATSSGSYSKDATEGFKQYSADVAKTVRAAMDGIGLPVWAKGMLDKLGDAPAIDDLVKTVDQITKSQEALKSLGAVMPQFAKLTDNATSTLLDAIGGADALAQSASSYYQNFYSEAERQAKSTEQLAKQFADLGIAVPATRDAFRALVESQDLTTESGAKTYAALLKLNPAFAELVQGSQSAAQSVSETAEKMAEAGRRALQSLAETGQGLQVDLLRAQGKGADADALAAKYELAKITADLSATDSAAAEAAYAANQAIKDQIKALTEANSRVERFTSTLAGLSSTRFDLENQLLSIQGKSGEVARRIRERDLAEMTKGLTAEEVERVAAAYDYNKSLEAQIEALNAANSAAQQAAQQQQQAAEQIKQAWQSLTDSLMGEVQRIRGQMEQDSFGGLASAQARFLITSSQARAGDQEAAKLLPGLSQSLLSLAGAQATSLLELQSIRSSTASSLEETAKILASRFGVTLPKLATGTNYVPGTMPALLHEGEAVIPKAYNPAAGGMGGSQELVAELQSLRAQNQQQAKDMAALQERMTRVLERWDFTGMPEQRETTT